MPKGFGTLLWACHLLVAGTSLRDPHLNHIMNPFKAEGVE